MPSYVDIELAKSAMKKAHDEDVELYGGVEIPECFPADDAINILNTLPKADVAPVIHAHWIRRYCSVTDDVLICSRCQRVINIPRNTPLDVVLKEDPYCHCGAKMDEEIDHVRKATEECLAGLRHEIATEEE